ncbi:MAG: AI-2E family transporter [Gemmatimonadales bacterium]
MALVALVVRTVDVLLVIFLSVLLGVYLRAIANVLHRRWQVPETVGLLAGVALTIGALVGLVFLVAPAVSAQVQDLLNNLPQFLTELDATISKIIRGTPLLGRYVGGGTSSLFGSTLSEIFGFLRGAAVPYLKGGVEFLIEGVSVVVMALYFARSPDIYLDGMVALTPPSHRALARNILDDLGTTLKAWVVGQLTSMVLLAALTTLGLWALGVPYFLAFGVFAGIAAIVPFFGTLLSTVIPALIALGVSGLPKSLAVAGVGVGVHLIEANFVAPVVMERQVNLPPVLTIAGVLLLGKLFGLAGLVVAVPILAVIMVLIRHILLGELYGDPVSESQSSGTVPAEANRTIAVRPLNP